MPVKCYRRADKNQRKYTTCKDENTGNQLRGGARPTVRRAPARRAAAPARRAAPARARRTSAPATQPVRRSNRVAARR